MFKKKDKLKEVNTKMSVINYVIMTNDIADGYFDMLTGEYQPHLGIANTMQLFYNKFYRQEKDEEIVSVNAFEAIAADDNFMVCFNDLIICEETFAYDFAHAYADAMDIVNTKKRSVDRMIAGLRDGIMDVLNTISPVMEKDGIDKLLELSKKVADGDVTAEKILDTFKDSKQYQEMVNSKKE